MNFLPDRMHGRTLELDGKQMLYFSGTSYLGMSNNAHFKARLIENLHTYSTVFSVSRNNNVQLSIYDHFEKEMALINGAEASLTVSSGMLAGQLVVRLLDHLPFIEAPNCHPAIWKNKNYSSEFGDQKQFENDIANKIAVEDRECVVTCNGIDHLTCEPLHFDWLKNLKIKQKIWLIIDDSHAIGMVDEETTASQYRKIKSLCPHNVKLIVVASLAKALSLPAGLILADDDVIQALRDLPFFVGASPAVPAYLATFIDLQEEYLLMKQKLSDNIHQFNDLLSIKLDDFKFLANYPVYYFPDDRLFRKLLEEDIFISCFSYPKPDDKPVCRIVLNALHTHDDINFLTEKISKYIQS